MNVRILGKTSFFSDIVHTHSLPLTRVLWETGKDRQYRSIYLFLFSDHLLFSSMGPWIYWWPIVFWLSENFVYCQKVAGQSIPLSLPLIFLCAAFSFGLWLFFSSQFSLCAIRITSRVNDDWLSLSSGIKIEHTHNCVNCVCIGSQVKQ